MCGEMYSQNAMNWKEHAMTEHGPEQAMKNLVDALPGIVFMCSPEPGWPMRCHSEGCRALLGLSPDELNAGDGLHMYRMMPPQDAARLIKSIDEAIAARRPDTCEYRVKTRNQRASYGTRRLELRLGTRLPLRAPPARRRHFRAARIE